MGLAESRIILSRVKEICEANISIGCGTCEFGTFFNERGYCLLADEPYEWGHSVIDKIANMPLRTQLVYRRKE